MDEKHFRKITFNESFELARKLNAAVEANGDHPVINSLTMPVPAGDGFNYVVYHKGDDHFELE